MEYSNSAFETERGHDVLRIEHQIDANQNKQYDGTYGYPYQSYPSYECLDHSFDMSYSSYCYDGCGHSNCYKSVSNYVDPRHYFLDGETVR